MRGASLVAVAVMAVLAGVVGIGSSSARQSNARVKSCASLGEAANFVAFTNEDFNATTGGGTSINGRIAAARDVTLDGVSVGPAVAHAKPREAGPTVIAGRDFIAGQTGHGGTLNGGVQYGRTATVADSLQGQRRHGACRSAVRLRVRVPVADLPEHRVGHAPPDIGRDGGPGPEFEGAAADGQGSRPERVPGHRLRSDGRRGDRDRPHPVRRDRADQRHDQPGRHRSAAVHEPLGHRDQLPEWCGTCPTRRASPSTTASGGTG